MAFGLFNAPSCLERLMECVLRGLKWKIALIYLDDVLVFSILLTNLVLFYIIDEHLQHLRQRCQP